MGLKWVALSAPVPGYEDEFDRLHRRALAGGLDAGERARLSRICVPPQAVLGMSRAPSSAAAPAAGEAPPGAFLSRRAAVPEDAAILGPFARVVFPAEMLLAAGPVVGEDLLAAAARSKDAAELVRYGEALAAAARTVPAEPEPGPSKPEPAPESLAALARTVDLCASWCLFWGRRGHGCLADPHSDL